VSTERLIARPWANHAATTVGVERAGEFVPLAECSGHGRMSTEVEPVALRLAACWNAFHGVPTDVVEIVDGTETICGKYVEACKQRDMLLAVAQQVRPWIAQQMLERGWPQERIDAPPAGSHLANLSAAIEAAKPKSLVDMWNAMTPADRAMATREINAGLRDGGAL